VSLNGLVKGIVLRVQTFSMVKIQGLALIGCA
jgi:hypothetical protein